MGPRGLRRGRRRERHTWPLALSDDEQLTLTTLAAKGYDAGLRAVAQPNEALHQVAEGVVDADQAIKRAEENRRARERADAIAQAPDAAARAKRVAEFRNEKARENAKADSEAAIRSAESRERAAHELEKRADANDKEAFRLRRREERLEPGRREPAKLVVTTSRFDLSLGKTTSWLGLAVISAVFEGAVILAPILQSELDLADLAMAGVTGAVVSMMATAVAIIGGRGLAADWEDKSWPRRGLLIAIGLFLVGVIVGLVMVRAGGWWIGCAVAATWTIAGLSGFDLERRATSIALLERASELMDAAANLRELAAGHRVAANEERESAHVVADVVQPEEPSLLHADAADTLPNDTGRERAAGLKDIYKGVVDHQIGLGQADRQEFETAPARTPAGERRLAFQGAMAAGAIGLVLAAGGYFMGSRDDDAPPPQPAVQPAPATEATP